MRVRAAALVCLVASAGALVGCGGEDGTTSDPAASPKPSDSAAVLEDPDRPPDLVVHGADGPVTAESGSYCWQHDDVGMCADAAMMDPAELPVVTGGGPLDIEFPVEGWSFTASITVFPNKPPSEHPDSAELTAGEPGSFRLSAPTEPGDFVVDLFGTGPQGDFSAAFRWKLSAALPEVVEWDGEGFAPPITLDLDGERVDLAPWTACYATGCYDGFARPPYVEVGGRSSVPFSFPDAGWDFEATFRSGDYGTCARAVTVPVRRTGDRTFEITPAGPPGRWLVDVFGRGDGGDVITTFAWTTNTAGTFPDEATGSAAVLADHDGELDSYGVELFVQDLAEQPERAEATVTVTSAEGRSVTLTPRGGDECYSEGSLSFIASDDSGRRATELGEGPFTYDVALTLDGTTYHGVGEWPTDETEDIAPHVPLTWTPALPAYAG